MMIDWMVVPSIGFGLLGGLFIFTGVASARRRKFVRLSLHSVLALVCLLSGALFITLHLSLQGYRALTREDLAATIQAEPTGPSQFYVTVHIPERQPERFQLAGDEIYIDAHILKWKPWANLFGLHTAYALDRLAGRYQAIEDERGKPHTVYALGGTGAVDLFLLRRRFDWLEPVVDAEYGSAAFFPARDPVSLELRVSATGLLFRPLTTAE
ncbi:MAG: hypothetical protein OEU68_12385 [Nitrospira sp.]|nr:hypothetical protein [Nitrospira sp.]MDH4244096.1 hypothetical protein [Nitrospira sp.]MDH4358192.1 hypothetical protein [Nitrospira sp.]MDH5320633.1 hypothetical protein [Nitrospira sp.]